MENMNVLVLAYLGDAIYELYIREYLVKYKYDKVGMLQNYAIHYVSAKAQRKYLQALMEQNYLTDKEIEIVKRGRNHNGNRHPKNTDIITYKYATGFEALIGYLYIYDKKRLDEIMELIIQIKEPQLKEKDVC